MSLFARLLIGMVALVAATSAATGWLAVHDIKASAIAEFVSEPSLSTASEALIKAVIFGATAGILVAIFMTIAMRLAIAQRMVPVGSGEMESPPALQQTREQEGANRLEHLSSRELEVFRYLIAGLANKEIARELQISPRTVEIHRGNLMRKLGTRNMVQLTQIAAVYGIEPLDTK